MASIKQLKKIINSVIDEINYDIELFVGLNLDKNHYKAQQLYEEVYLVRVKYLEKVQQIGLSKNDYRSILEEFYKEVDRLNQQLVEIIKSM
ncbi:MAG TPA: hypothetical protein PK990_10755 [Salinivirgaceae bacterium]|nr:hypothetical protein [Salinivirgaceae bacterium]